MAKTNFNDLFKSELGSPDQHLIDCPNCEHPITEGDIAKAHGGKGKVTHLTGAKHGKSSAHVVDHNPEGGVMRGGHGRGVHSPSRGVPGADKVDEVHVQSTTRSKRKDAAAHQANTPSKKIPHMEKAERDDDSSSDSSSDDVEKSGHDFIVGEAITHNGKSGTVGKHTTDTHVHFKPDKDGPGQGTMVPHAGVRRATTKKSITIRGTEHVQWIDDGSDAALAKSIAEGALGGTPPTQPLDLNNDLTRLLI